MLLRKFYHKTQYFQFSIVQNADLEIVILIFVNFLKVSLRESIARYVIWFAEIAIVKKLQISAKSTEKYANFFANSNFTLHMQTKWRIHVVCKYTRVKLQFAENQQKNSQIFLQILLLKNVIFKSNLQFFYYYCNFYRLVCRS